MKTVVFIPGLVSDQIIWAPLAARIPQNFQVHQADLSDGTSITGMAQKQLDETVGDVIAVGHSMGGRVAMEMARLAPERVKGLVLANTGHHAKRDGEEIKRQQMIDLGHDSIAKLAASWLPPMLDPARVGDTDLIRELSEMVCRAGPQVHERHIRALLGRPNATASLPEIACPILLVAARQDGWSPIAQHKEIAAVVADAELVVIENAGHFAPVERPAETSAAVIDWLSRKFGESHG
ncbi:alpha/beta fold hydrolase [Neorhizobium tomejilense]|uniref:alpha/beta fold hydrolase n=1 Tax=Neorhizobium tomejilense TaxID=2093828 RepID=UPI000CF9135E|nr:alpha/beta hydrolase [Neorhizobium tomejilense]